MKDIAFSKDNSVLVIAGENMMFLIYTQINSNYELKQTVNFSGFEGIAEKDRVEFCSISNDREKIAFKGNMKSFYVFIRSSSGDYVFSHKEQIQYGSHSPIYISPSGTIVTADSTNLYVFQ